MTPSQTVDQTELFARVSLSTLVDPLKLASVGRVRWRWSEEGAGRAADL